MPTHSRAGCNWRLATRVFALLGKPAVAPGEGSWGGLMDPIQLAWMVNQIDGYKKGPFACKDPIQLAGW